jgi:acetyl-CoA synthetase
MELVQFLNSHFKSDIKDQIFVLFLREGNDPEDYTRITYKKLLEQVCKCANVLKAQGVAKGDRVAIYMPMVLELVVTMLACSRIGAVHSIVVSTH